MRQYLLRKIISVPRRRIRAREQESVLNADSGEMAIKRQKQDLGVKEDFAWLQNPRMQIVLENASHLSTSNFLLHDGHIVSPAPDNSVSIAELATGRVLKKLEGHTEIIRCLARHEDMLASGSDDGTVRLWNLRTASHIGTLEGHGHFEGDPKSYDHRIRSVALNEKWVVSSSSDDNSTRIWEIASGRCRHVLRGITSANHGVTFLGNQAVLGRYPAQLVNLETGNTEHRFETVKVMRESMVIHQGNLISGDSDGNIRIWDLNTGNCLRTFGGHKQLVSCLLPYHDFLFSGSWDTSIKVWHIPTGECIRTLGISIEAVPEEWSLVSRDKGHTNWVNELFLQENALISVSSDRSIRRWTFGQSL